MDRQYVEWYKVNLENGKLSEAKIKTEAVKFFDLAAEELNKYKKKGKKTEVSENSKRRNEVWFQIQRLVFKSIQII